MKISRSILILGMILLLSLSACGEKTATSDQNPGTTVSDSTGSVSSDEPATTGKGEFDLVEPAVGLSGLTSYQATLVMKFEGTKDGSPFSAEQQFTLTTDRTTALRTLSESYRNSNGENDKLDTTSMGGLVYLVDEEAQSCSTAPASESSGRVYEPAGSLPSFRGGEKAGSETIEGVNTMIYTFDAPALNTGKNATANGKVWIADPGGWVVKYSLSLHAGEEVYGKGYEGTQTWEYTLTQANTAVVGLPQGCSAPLTGMPVLEDAVNLQQLPGGMHYFTVQSVDAAGSYYKEQLASGGWEMKNEYLTGAVGAQWLFTKMEGEKELTLLVLAQPQEDGTLMVSLMQVETKAVSV